MSRPLLFATTNPGKLRELSALAPEGTTVVSLKDFPPLPEVEEDEPTLEGNALKKALAYAKATGMVALADDSGLCVDALDGRPGVHSARYAPTDAERIAKLLEEMKEVPDEQRTASFRCALCLASPKGRTYVEVGRCAGTVLRAPRGTEGFGYDPILFVPALGKGLAELSLEQKAKVSHRAEAFRRLMPKLEAFRNGRWP